MSSVSVWPKKAWSIDEEYSKKKNKSLEEKYDVLLSDFHDLRLTQAKTQAKLRELERYKEISENVASSANSSRRY
jgi:hypothetical protein